MKKQVTTVFFPFGGLPALVTSIKGYQRDYSFQRMVIFHSNPVNKEHIKKLAEHKKFIKNQFNVFEITWVGSGFKDLLTQKQNLVFFEKVIEQIRKEKAAGNQVMICIAGGRKTMSALMLTAAYMTGIPQIHHVLLAAEKEGDWKQSNPADIRMIPNPYLNIAPLLEHIVKEIDDNHQFGGSIFKLIQELKTEKAFSRVNTYLFEQSRARKIREEFRNRLPAYERMITVTEMIVGNLLKDKLMYTPAMESRTKDFKSLIEKVKRKEIKEGRIEDPFTRIKDIAGIRVIFYNSIDMQKAIRLLQSADDFVNADPKGGKRLTADDRSKRYKYRATHFDVKLNPAKRLNLPEHAGLKDICCEIQLTTIFAHAWNKVEHAIRYKKQNNLQDSAEVVKREKLQLREAAKKLEAIEQDINLLCKEHFNKK